MAWCAEVNGTEHSEICAVPAERLVIERELLAALPSLRAAAGRLVTRKVGRLSCVRFASPRSRCPVALIGAEVRLRTDDGRLLVIMTGAGQVVARGGVRRGALDRAVAFSRWRAARRPGPAAVGLRDRRGVVNAAAPPPAPDLALGIASQWPFDQWGRFVPVYPVPLLAFRG
jgi:hypothetical protein